MDVETIDKMKQYCLDKYEEGGDVMVECWSDTDWREFCERCARFDVSVWDELKSLIEYYRVERTNARIESGFYE